MFAVNGEKYWVRAFTGDEDGVDSGRLEPPGEASAGRAVVDGAGKRRA